MDLSVSTFTATGFVAGLAAIGALSHQGAGPLPRADLISGAFQSAYEDRFAAANPLERFAVGALASVRYAVLNETHEGAVAGKDGWLFTAEELETHEDFAANLRASAAHVADVRDQLAARGVRLITAVIPDKAEIYPEQLRSARPDAVRGRLQAFLGLLDEAGVERADAHGALRRAMASGPVFMTDDTHWSPRGARAVADEIGRRLAKADIARTTVATARIGRADFNGDLLAFVPTGPFRPFAGPPQRSIDRFETVVDGEGGGGGLFGDAVIDVALIGTSFSARTDFHFEGFLKNALGADVLNLSLEGRGPFAPMDAFLQSETLELTPPKIVIWEIPVRYVSKDLNS